jgi:uncharacterized protein
MAFSVVAAAFAEDPVGNWSGTLALPAPQGATAVGIIISKGADGKLAGVGRSASSTAPIVIDVVTSDGSKLSFTANGIQGAYEGTWDAASKSWKGTWKQQGQDMPLALARVP